MKFLFTWKKKAVKFTKEQQDVREKGEGSNRVKRVRSAFAGAHVVMNIYKKLKVNGEWFLWKLYISAP